MRKGFVLVVLLCAGMAVRAQIEVGVDFGASIRNYSHERGGAASFDKELPQGWEMKVVPYVGYAFRNGWSAGVVMSVGHSDYAYTDGIFNPDAASWEKSEVSKKTLTGVSAGINLSKVLYSWGSVSFQVELGVGYDMNWGTTTLTQYTNSYIGDASSVVTSRDMREGTFYIQLLPQLCYDFSEHLSVDVNLNFAALLMGHTATVVYEEKSKMNDGKAVFSKTATNVFDLGSHGQEPALVSLGFTYSF